MNPSVVRNGSLVNLAAFVILVAGIKTASALVVPLLLAMFLAIICAPLLFWLQSKKVPGALAILAILFGVIIIFLGVGTLVGSSLAEFSKNLPEYQERLRLMMEAGITWLLNHGVALDKNILSEAIDPGKIMGIAANTLNGLGGALTNGLLILFMFLFLLLEASGIPTKIQAMVGKESGAINNYGEITRGVNRYLAIKTMTSLVTGVIVTCLLLVIGVDFAVMWGVVAFLLNFIPSIGSIIAAIPAVLLALIQLGPEAAALSAVGYLIVNVLIGSIVEPKVMGKDMGLSTLIVFLSLTFWGWVLGPVGMLLSVPLTMTVKIILDGNPSTKWLAILLGSNREASELLKNEQ